MKKNGMTKIPIQIKVIVKYNANQKGNTIIFTKRFWVVSFNRSYTYILISRKASNIMMTKNIGINAKRKENKRI
jgi:hypothetical protein